ncbi:TIGR04282 family arsenosugar biosynthesis glycosyltransferase [Xiamenia xianingshaonis]|uniref:DUF2064 domain-containing protein n=1 Tax=Xiamenia xianingshaonis TaxID=2682776 RepID=A0A9E6SU57_9ACTN|nr:DUF2064 domain-containing protein [Xiamenia xianingshaonis]NHM14307.1 DUF2064 domain-containing protein [Xiamenia xianingshaonis]QTU84084.1 DUF2064 domain-containing protein [Xiamenia xianingshaonis]
MKVRRNALLLFSKVPEPGKVKTRLTPLKDGLFDPGIASYLYHCMLFDVAEICCDALADLERKSRDAAGDAAAGDAASVFDEYTLIISSPGADQERMMRELFAESGVWPRPIEFIHDEGASFDEHYNDAFSQVWDGGFDTVLSMGCDMPALRRSIVTEGFERLHQLCEVPGGGIVLAPDQELGVSVVGWTSSTDFDHSGVFYNQDGLTVLPAYIRKCKALGLPALYLPDVPDVDTMRDLDHHVTLVEALVYCAQFQDDVTPPWRTAEALREVGYTDVRIMPNNLFDPRGEIDR